MGPRPCPMCYLPVEQALDANARVLRQYLQCSKNLTYVHDENPVRVKEHGGSEFGGYPSLKERTDLLT
ncbi:hypothetical protein MLD38_000638 [Melastoma candidum]|uniref:Uncharacterized protein n=1 Tax=Melastoma candidum TaxID=119954 RepID=A0ACB9SBL3_9MYRT|nr:hypothetical protein MLD38_000638 [Melastoma candidum]